MAMRLLSCSVEETNNPALLNAAAHNKYDSRYSGKSDRVNLQFYLTCFQKYFVYIFCRSKKVTRNILSSIFWKRNASNSWDKRLSLSMPPRLELYDISMCHVGDVSVGFYFELFKSFLMRCRGNLCDILH